MVVYFIRHGEAEHNHYFRLAEEAAASGSQAQHDALKAKGYSVEDSALTALGEAQAARLRTVLASKPPFDLVVSSPMRRAIQTTTLVFGNEGGNELRVLVQALARERDGGLGRRCDSGSLRSALEAQFGGNPMGVRLEWGELPEHWCLRHEQLCQAAGVDPIGEQVSVAMVADGRQNAWREPEADVETRVGSLHAWLKGRPEARIAVVGHGDFWKHFTSLVYGRPIRLPNCGFVAFAGLCADAPVVDEGDGSSEHEGSCRSHGLSNTG